MFERFTDSARDVVLAAVRLAAAQSAESVGVKHLVAALLHGHTSAADTLRKHGASDLQLPTPPDPEGQPTAGFRFSEGVKTTLAGACGEAARLGQDFVTTEHLLIAVLTLDKDEVAEALRRRQLKVSTLRAGIRRRVRASHRDAQHDLGEAAASVPHRRRKLTRNQQIALWGLLIAAMGTVAYVVALVWQTRVTRSAYTGPWIRFEYYVCTGPYNNTLATFQALPQAASETGHQPRRPDFLIRNPVHDVIQSFEPVEGVTEYNRGGPVTTMAITEDVLDLLTGTPDSRERIRGFQQSEGRRPVADVDRKMRQYFEYFRNHRPTVQMLATVRTVPPWVATILKTNPTYDEAVDLAIAYGPHSDAITGYAYFRSTRTVHVRIENVSPFNLTRIALQLKAFGPFEALSLVASAQQSGEVQRAVFPLDVLRPGEAVVYPLSVSLLPHLEASSLVPGLRSPTVKNEDLYDTSERYPRATLLSSANQRLLEVRPSYELELVRFHVLDEDETLESIRPIAVENLIQVSKTCECGSCPVLNWRTKDGRWARAREILTDFNGPGEIGDFDLEIPAGVDAISIVENPAEETTLKNLEVITRSPDGDVKHHPISLSDVRITSREPLLIDLELLLGPQVRARVKGRGFYVASTEVVCPYVFPLPSWWIRPH